MTDPSESEPSGDGLPLPDAAGAGLFGETPLRPAAAADKPATPYRVLARKYRPTTFDDLIGQEAMVRILRNAFAMGRVAHAFMLTGVRGVGKTTTARIIARALNCVGPDGRGGPTADPCGVCPNCTAILADRHPDVLEMDAASRTGVDDVREIIEATRFRPMQARAKVFVIDEVHMLSRNAFNALLKTLEEPPPHVTFVFATTELRKVPVTVLSRCQRFDLRRVPLAVLSAHFGAIARQEGVAVAPAALDLIARAADGSVRDGLSLLDQAIAQGSDRGGRQEGEIGPDLVADMLGLADRGLVFDLLEAVMAGQAARALEIADGAYARGADLGLMLADLLDLTHTLTRLKTVPGLRDSHDLPEAERQRGGALAETLSIPVLARMWQMLLKGIGEVEQAPDRRSAAEMVLIRLCHVAELPTPGDLVRQLAGAAPAPVGAVPSGGAMPTASAQPPPVVAAQNFVAATPPVVPPPQLRGHGGPATALRLAVVAETPQADDPATVAVVAPVPSTVPEAPLPPELRSWRELVAFVATQREALLHGHLRHSAHLVRLAPPVIELRVQPEAPRDMAQRLAKLLLDATGTRWTIALSTAPGEPTLAEQQAALDATRQGAAEAHPLVRAILEAFPGARLGPVRDSSLDDYGLPPEITPVLAEPDDTRAFAPPADPDERGLETGEPPFDPDDPMEYDA